MWFSGGKIYIHVVFCFRFSVPCQTVLITIYINQLHIESLLKRTWFNGFYVMPELNNKLQVSVIDCRMIKVFGQLFMYVCHSWFSSFFFKSVTRPPQRSYTSVYHRFGGHFLHRFIIWLSGLLTKIKVVNIRSRFPILSL